MNDGFILSVVGTICGAMGLAMGEPSLYFFAGFCFVIYFLPKTK